jgi:hypothetical protein
VRFCGRPGFPIFHAGITGPTELFLPSVSKQFCLIDFPLDYSGKFRHVYPCKLPSPHMGWQEEATVVRLSTHISALSAANAWSFNRPSDCRYVRTGWSKSFGFTGMRPEQAFKTPR